MAGRKTRRQFPDPSELLPAAALRPPTYWDDLIQISYIF